MFGRKHSQKLVFVVLTLLSLSQTGCVKALLDNIKGYLEGTSVERICGAINAGLAMNEASNLSKGQEGKQFFESLDEQTGDTWASDKTPLFGYYIKPPTVQPQWYKFDETCYAYDLNQDLKIDNKNDICLYYDPEKGIAGKWADQNSYCSRADCQVDHKAPKLFIQGGTHEQAKADE